ncbi:MAG: rRNA maturation RNase YbeY [Syntrophales bacterium]
MTVSIKNHQTLFNIDLIRVRKSMKILLKELDCSDKEIGLLLVDDNQIQKLNNDYLDRNFPTNVISFSMTEGEFGNINPQILGDIVISVETASRDAANSQIDLPDELDFLIIHGLLHLLGYNHESTSAETSRAMNTREQQLFFLLRHYHLD